MTANEMLQYYREHRMTVDEAVKLVNSGDLIIDGHGHGRSDTIWDSLCTVIRSTKDTLSMCPSLISPRQDRLTGRAEQTSLPDIFLSWKEFLQVGNRGCCSRR